MEEGKKETRIAFDTEEGKLLFGSENRFGVYQLRAEDDLGDYLYRNSGELERYGLAVEKAHYDLVYTGKLETEEPYEGLILDDLFERYHEGFPTESSADPLSTSDVIVLHRNGENSCHYVEDLGFSKLEDFLAGIVVDRRKEQDVELPDELALAVADRYIAIEKTEEGFNYSVYGRDFLLLDGGMIEDTQTTIFNAAKSLVAEMKDPERKQAWNPKVIGAIAAESTIRRIHPERLTEAVERAEASRKELEKSLMESGFRLLGENERTPFDEPEGMEHSSEGQMAESDDGRKNRREHIRQDKASEKPNASRVSLRERLGRKVQEAAQRNMMSRTQKGKGQEL